MDRRKFIRGAMGAIPLIGVACATKGITEARKPEIPSGINLPHLPIKEKRGFICVCEPQYHNYGSYPRAFPEKAPVVIEYAHYPSYQCLQRKRLLNVYFKLKKYMVDGHLFQSESVLKDLFGADYNIILNSFDGDIPEYIFRDKTWDFELDVYDYLGVKLRVIYLEDGSRYIGG